MRAFFGAKGAPLALRNREFDGRTMNTRTLGNLGCALALLTINAACAARGPAVVHHEVAGDALPITLEVRADESLAYRCRRWAGIDDGTFRAIDGEDLIFLERDQADELVLRTGPAENARTLGNGIMADHHDLVRVYFPTGELRNDALVEQRWVLGRLGSNSVRSFPDAHIEEAMGFGEREDLPDHLVTLSASRTYTYEGTEPSSENVYAHYNVERRRYERIQRIYDRRATSRGLLPTLVSNPSPHTKLECTLDVGLSAERRERRRDRQGLGVAVRSLRGVPWQADIDAEIDRYLAEDTPSLGLRFHLRRDAMAVWQRILANPDHHHHCTSAMRVEPPEQLAGLLSRHLSSAPIASCIIDASWHPFRPLLQRIAEGSTPHAERARVALERPAPTLERLRTALGVADVSPDAAALIYHEWVAVMTLQQWFAPTVELLVETLPNVTPRDAPDSIERTLRGWLENLTCQTFGSDHAAWSAFWDGHKEQSYAEWMLEAAASDDTLAQSCALARLRMLEPSDAVRAAAMTHLTHEHAQVRLHAAALLHRDGERRGTAMLVSMLDYPWDIRDAAFVALAPRSAGTLGFNEESELARSVAASHWRAWLAEGSPTP